MAKGKEPTAFVETQEETTGPLTLVGQTEVAFLTGSERSRTIAIASLADRRIIRKLEGPKGAEIDSMVSSPDSKTIYYAAAGSIWRVPVNDGKPEKIRTGDSVTMDPYAHQLILRITDKDGTRLVRAPLDGGPDQPIALQKDVRLAPLFLSSNAVGKDGRILAQQAPPSSWFWPLGLIDPRSGQAPLLQVGYDADMTGGWASDGTLVIVSQALHATLLRSRPEASSPK
jgi:hypothetical protein